MTTTTTPNLCLPPGYVSRADPAYFVDDTRVVWQPDVYKRVAGDPRCAGVTTALDVGCGRGDKVVKAFWHVSIIGVDYGTNIAGAIQRHEIGAWFAVDLDREWPEWIGLRWPDAVIICADVIEHLRDPSVLLQGLADAHRSGCPLIAVSSPDRDRVHGPGHLGPPANPCHAREWSAAELVALFAGYGMAAEQEWTRSSTLGPEQNTTLLLVGQ